MGNVGNKTKSDKQRFTDSSSSSNLQAYKKQVVVEKEKTSQIIDSYFDGSTIKSKTHNNNKNGGVDHVMVEFSVTPPSKTFTTRSAPLPDTNHTPKSCGGSPVNHHHQPQHQILQTIDKKTDFKNADNVFKCGGTRFVLPPHYSFKKLLGKGSYGVVVQCMDLKLNKFVAIKKIPRLFEDVVDAKRVLREVKVTRSVNHPNISKLIDIFTKPNSHLDTFEEIYLVFDVMDVDLEHALCINRHKWTEVHTQFVMAQLLSALHFLHSHHIVHRDIKPANILINGDGCHIRLTDFGLTRLILQSETQNEKQCKISNSLVPSHSMTTYMVTRSYRAPELMLKKENYDCSSDIWSAGCIMAELLALDKHGMPFFHGKTNYHQLELIFAHFGSPSLPVLKRISSSSEYTYWSLRGRYLAPNPIKWPFHASSDALHLLARLLDINPETRISAEQALKHPFLKSSSNSLPSFTASFQPCDWSFETKPLSIPVLRQLFWQECNKS